jgi:hypothetical protein
MHFFEFASPYSFRNPFQKQKKMGLRERPLLVNCNVYNGLINKFSVRCRGGRTVQAAACRAAICGFNSHPRLFNTGWVLGNELELGFSDFLLFCVSRTAWTKSRRFLRQFHCLLSTVKQEPNLNHHFHAS